MLDTEGFLRLLGSRQIEYVVIGGLAMIAHGSAYITKDMDICYNRSPANLAAVAAAFAEIHPYLRGAPPGLPFRFDAPTIQAGLNFTLVTDLGDIDLLGEVSGVGGYDQALAQSVEKQIFGYSVRVLSIDSLIAAKRAAGRLKDKNHVLELEELKKMRDTAP
jgi:predicted nucleotidyltransferase